jgi:hypothetical protein
MLNRRLVTLAAAAVAVVIALALTGSGSRHHRAPPSTPRRQPSAWLVVQSVPPSLSAAAARTTPLVPVTDARTAATTTSFTTTILDGHRSTPTVTVEPTTTISVGRDPTAATERASRVVVMLTSWRYDTAPNDLTGLATANVIQQFRIPASELERRTTDGEVAWAITTPTTLTVLDTGQVEVTLTVAQHVITNTTGETVRSLTYTIVLTDQPSGWIVEDVRT